MSTSMIEITKVNLRDVHMPCSSARTGSRPFVVCSTNTKRYASPLSTKPPAIQLQRFPLRTAANTRPSVSLEASTNQKARPGSLLTVVPKDASASLYPVPIPAPGRTTKTLRLPTRGNARHEKTCVFEPTQTSKGDKAGRFRASMQSTQDDLPPRPSRIPCSRIPRTSSGIPTTGKGKPDIAVKVAASACNRGADCRVYTNTRVVKIVRCPQVSSPSADWSPPSPNLSSFPSQTWTIVVSAGTERNKTSAMVCSDETTPSTVGGESSSSEEATGKTPVTINSDGISHGVQAGSKSISRVEGMVETQTTVSSDAVFDVGNRFRAPLKATGYLHPEYFAFPSDWSPPPSPNLSSFPSQTWTVHVDTGTKRNKTATMVCDGETLSELSSCDEPKSGEGPSNAPATICGDAPYSNGDEYESKYGVAATIEASTRIGSHETPSDVDDGLKSSITGMPNDSCVPSESSFFPSIVDSPTWHTTCATRSEATGGLSRSTIDPSVGVLSMVCPAPIILPSENGTTSVARLARLRGQHQTSSGGDRTQTVVHRAIRAARTLFLPPRRGLQSKEAVALPAMGTDLSRIHRRFVPKLDKGVKQDKDPTVQKKIVAGWW